MKWYVIDTDTGDLIDGPYDDEDDAWDEFTEKLKDPEWCDEHGISPHSEMEAVRKWWMSGWTIASEWYSEPVTMPKNNPDTTWYLHNRVHQFCIGIEQNDDEYFVGIFDETKDVPPLLDGESHKHLGPAILKAIEYAITHTEYHSNEPRTPSIDNISVPSSDNNSEGSSTA